LPTVSKGLKIKPCQTGDIYLTSQNKSAKPVPDSTDYLYAGKRNANMNGTLSCAHSGGNKISAASRKSDWVFKKLNSTVQKIIQI
jgi:hypothetical protein